MAAPRGIILSEKTGRRLVMALILLAAFFLRVRGSGFGLPHLYHADEPVIVNHALAYAAGGFNPHFFKIPPLTSYALFALYGLYFAAGLVSGRFSSPADMEMLFYRDPGSLYWLARFVFGVLAGTACVWALERLVRRFVNAGSALTAAFFLAVCFLHARDSHYVYADIPLTLALIGAFYAAFRAGKYPASLKAHLLAGAMIGVCAAVKYNGIFAAVVYAWVTWRRSGAGRLPRFWLAAGLAAASSFLILNPFAALDFSCFARELSVQSQSNTGVGFWHHLAYSLRGGTGLPLAVLGLIGVARGLLAKRPEPQSLAVFILVYYGALCLWGQPYDRYILPLLPPLLLLASDALGAICGRFGVRRGPVYFLAAFLIALPSLARILLFNGIMDRTDTRTLAKAWVEGHIPAGRAIALDWDFYMPRLRFSAQQLDEKRQELMRDEGASSARLRRLDAIRSIGGDPAYRLFFLVPDPSAERFMFAKPVLPFREERLRTSGIDWVIVSEPGSGPEEFYERLRARAKLSARFSPFRDRAATKSPDARPLTGGPFLLSDLAARERNGPLIEIYRLKAGAERAEDTARL